MSMWGWILLACVAAYALKLAGYLLPASLLDRPFVPSLAGALTVGLLASLVVSNTVAAGQEPAPADAQDSGNLQPEATEFNTETSGAAQVSNQTSPQNSVIMSLKKDYRLMQRQNATVAMYLCLDIKGFMSPAILKIYLKWKNWKWTPTPAAAWCASG